MRLGVVGLKIAFLGLALVLTIAFLVACGGYKSPNTNQNVSGVKFRAFVSQNVSTSSVSGGLDPGPADSCTGSIRCEFSWIDGSFG